MSLTTCRECKREISTEAKACPQCGALSPGGKRTSKWAIGLAVFLALAILGRLTKPVTDAQKAAQIAGVHRRVEPGDVPLPATLLYSATQAGIRNDTTVPFGKCNLYVNPGVVSDGYVATIDGPTGGHEVAVGLLAFADGAERFNPFTTKVIRVKARCFVGSVVRQIEWFGP
jgi:hypothetical protein